MKALIITSFICDSLCFLKHCDTWINESMLWRLKTDYCVIRWLCKGSAVSSYCLTDWMKARSDDIAAGSERRVYPLASRRDRGQWLWVHGQRIYKHLSTQLFSMLIKSSLPSIHRQYKPHFTWTLWTLRSGWVWGPNEVLDESPAACLSICFVVNHNRAAQ